MKRSIWKRKRPSRYGKTGGRKGWNGQKVEEKERGNREYEESKQKLRKMRGRKSLRMKN